VRERIVPARATTLAVITGNGLKDTRSALEAAPQPIDVPPDLAAVEAALAR
jgi:threonine synthase